MRETVLFLVKDLADERNGVELTAQHVMGVRSWRLQTPLSVQTPMETCVRIQFKCPSRGRYAIKLLTITNSKYVSYI
jgi:hypothetical protein